MRLLPLILTTTLAMSVSLLGARPAAAAAAAPLITASSASIGPPTVLPDFQCNEGNIACGLFGLTVTFSQISALPVGEFSASLFGQAHVIRVFGCVAADGTRLRDRDVVDERNDRLSTRRAFPLSRRPGETSITGSVYDLFGNGPTPDCPTGSSAALLSIHVSSITLQLSTLGENAMTFDYTVQGSWGWGGRVTTTAPAPIAAGPLRLDGWSIDVVPPTSQGAAANCPAVNGCGRIEFSTTPYRPGDRTTLIRGAVKASGTLVRHYGCNTPAGRRLPRYNTRVVEPAAFNGGPGKVFTLVAGNDSTRVTLVRVLDDRQPGNCPSDALPDRGPEGEHHPGGLHQTRTTDHPARAGPVKLVGRHPDRGGSGIGSGHRRARSECRSPSRTRWTVRRARQHRCRRAVRPAPVRWRRRRPG